MIPRKTLFIWTEMIIMKNIAKRKIWLLITTACTTHVTLKKANSMWIVAISKNLFQNQRFLILINTVSINKSRGSKENSIYVDKNQKGIF